MAPRSTTLIVASAGALLVAAGVGAAVLLLGNPGESNPAEGTPTTLAGAVETRPAQTPSAPKETPPAPSSPSQTPQAVPSPTATPPATLTPSELAALIPPGATVEQIEYAELIPGGGNETVVVYTTDPPPECAGSPAQARGVNLTVFAVGPGGEHRQLVDGLTWPSGDRPIVEPSAMGGFCWAVSEVRFETVRMRPDRDYLAVSQFLHSGVSSGAGRIAFVGYEDDAFAVLHEDGRTGSIQVDVLGDEVRYRAGLRLRRDANCCPSAERLVTVGYDEQAGRLAPGEPVIVPRATEGTVVGVFDQSGLLSQEAGASIEGGSIILAPEGATGFGTIYAVDAATTLDGNAGGTFSVGDRLRVVEWEARDTDADFEGELQAVEVVTLQ